MQISTFHGLRSGASLALFVSLLAAANGCAYGTTKQVVRAQFAAELSCPDTRVDVSKRYDEAYKPGQLTATGCGVTRIYDCPADAGFVSYDDEKVCTFTAVNAAKPPQAATPPADAMESDLDDPALEEPPLEEPADAPADAADEKPKASGKAGLKPSGKFKAGASLGSD